MFTIAPVYAIWLACFITALNVVLSKMATPYITSAVFLLLACALATVCFAIYFRGSGEMKKMLRRDVWPKALGMGTFGTALPMTVFMVALNYTTPVNAAIMNQFEIIYSLILAAILLKERPSLTQLGGSALIILGVIMLVAKAGTSLQAKGALLIIGCLWMYQVSHIFAKKLPSDLSPQFIAAARAAFAMPALAILVICLAIWQPGGLLLNNTSSLWIILITSAVLNYFIGNSFWYQAIRNMDLSKATAIILSYPVITCILSIIAGQDTFSVYKVTGMVLALGGAYIVTGSAKNNK